MIFTGCEDPLNLDDHWNEVSRKKLSKEMSPMKPPPPKVSKLAAPKVASPEPKTSLLGLVSYSSSEEDI